MNRLNLDLARRKNSIIFFIFCFTLMGISVAFSDETSEPVASEDVRMVIGELEPIKVSGLTRISLTNPSVADIVNYDENEILLIAKTVGQTVLFVWDDQGKRPILIYVAKTDLQSTKDRLKNLLSAAGIETVKMEINEKEAKLILTGEIIKDKEAIFGQMLEDFTGAVLNLVKIEPIQDLVQIDMQITELNTTLNKTLGIGWTQTADYAETMSTNYDGTPKDFLKIGDFQRTTALLATVNALIEEGKGRVLSKPRLVVISGEEASFLVGGEVPIKTTTIGESGAFTENVEFKEFGVSMVVTPEIVKNRIDLKLTMEVSEVDASSAGTSESEVGFTTRSANTHLFLDDGQTIVMAGLIKQSQSKSTRKVPFLGDIPLVGLLFRKTSNPVADVDQELVISLTPHILTDRLTEKEREITNNSNDADDSHKMYMADDPASLTVPYYVGIPKEMDAYVQSVQDKISQAMVYPEEAQQKGWEGTVKVSLLILQDGTLAYASIKESSGREIFDELAINTARTVAPYAGFPANTDLRELNITIPLVYSLNR